MGNVWGAVQGTNGNGINVCLTPNKQGLIADVQNAGGN